MEGQVGRPVESRMVGIPLVDRLDAVELCTHNRVMQEGPAALPSLYFLMNFRPLTTSLFCILLETQLAYPSTLGWRTSDVTQIGRLRVAMARRNKDWDKGFHIDWHINR
jgi:hypothetical protein